tara:strand:+ start:1770 stop:2348 length:579 start_codon:yes stop_codon:yes gene_type:complete
MPNVILRLSGTFGSGKTTAVRKFIEDYPSETLMGGKKIMGYRIDLTSLDVEKPLFIVGKYDNVCGGTDSINTQLEVAERIIKAHALGHVLYEGALVSASGLGGKVTQITEETGCTVYAFLDTPQDKCIDRVINRRLTAGNTKEFDPKNLVAKFGGVTACRQHVTEAGFRVVDVDHMNTHPPLVKIIKDFEIS